MNNQFYYQENFEKQDLKYFNLKVAKKLSKKLKESFQGAFFHFELS